MQITKIENEKLLSDTKLLVKEERRVQVQLLLHLQEIERRKLFLELGYGSLFDFVTKELGYSESAGYRRIQAMRLMKSVPTIEQKLADGSITLTTAAQVQSFLRSEQKSNNHSNSVDAFQLVNRIENKSSRDVEKCLLSLKPSELLTSEKVRQLTPTHVEIKLVIPDELRQMLDQLRLLFSHVNPNMNYQELISHLASTAIKKYTFEKLVDRRLLPAPEVNVGIAEVKSEVVNRFEQAKEQGPPKRSRYISREVRLAVWTKFNGCCSFKNNETQKICGSQFQVQLDHIIPFALGGGNEADNLRLLCAQHNRLQSEKIFGKGRR